MRFPRSRDDSCFGSHAWQSFIEIGSRKSVLQAGKVRTGCLRRQVCVSVECGICSCSDFTLNGISISSTVFVDQYFVPTIVKVVVGNKVMSWIGNSK